MLIPRHLMSFDTPRLAAFLRFVWAGPSGLPSALESEWRLVVIRWLGIAFMLPSIGLLHLPPNHVPWAYGLLWVACVYNGLAQRSLRRTHRLFLNGYFTTVGDALLNVAMVTLGGGFG